MARFDSVVFSAIFVVSRVNNLCHKVRANVFCIGGRGGLGNLSLGPPRHFHGLLVLLARAFIAARHLVPATMTVDADGLPPMLAAWPHHIERALEETVTAQLATVGGESKHRSAEHHRFAHRGARNVLDHIRQTRRAQQLASWRDQFRIITLRMQRAQRAGCLAWRRGMNRIEVI